MRGVDALPHLDLRHDQGDVALPVDPDEGVRREGPGRRRLAALGPRNAEAEYERRSRGLPMTPRARRIGESLHGRPWARVLRHAAQAPPAARLMASRMRT